MLDKMAFNNYDLITSIVKEHFQIKESYLREDGSVEFRIIPSKDMKQNFVKLVNNLKKNGFIAFLTKMNEEVVLIAGKMGVTRTFGNRVPIILFILTLLTIIIDGYIRSISFPKYEGWLMTFLYTLSIMGIVLIHEMGHKLTSAKHGAKSSLPYFIPGIPGVIPTLGAVILSSEPPVNRDSLFDLGLSGPLSGLIVSIFVAIGGVLTSPIITIEEFKQLVESGVIIEVKTLDIFTEFLLRLFIKPSSGAGPILSPLLFASSLGFLITFLNLMPAWQLDGGHIARAALGKRWHKLTTYLSIIVMGLLGFWTMAIILLLLSSMRAETRPLDDISPLSKIRKIGFFLTIILAAALFYFTIYNNPIFRLLIATQE